MRDGDDYIVNGQKTWTTLAQYGDWIFNLVRTDPAAPKQRGISMLLIDMRSPGVTVRPIHLIDGGYEVNEVFFEDVRVPADQLVGEENKGWTYAKFLLGNERTSNAGVGMIKNRIARIKRLAGPLLGRPAAPGPGHPAGGRDDRAGDVGAAGARPRVVAAARHARPDFVGAQAAGFGAAAGRQRAARRRARPGRAHLPRGRHVPEGFAGLPEGAVDAMPTYFNWRKASIYAGSNEVQRGIIAKAILKF